MVIYGDDIIITENNELEIDILKSRLEVNFKLMDLGRLSYILV